MTDRAPRQEGAAQPAGREPAESGDDGVPSPRECCWRLVQWIALMALIGGTFSLIGTH
jgi:hypothetical protein